MTLQRLSIGPVVLAILVLAACAHVPADRSAAATPSPPPKRVLVTGSHIPQRIDARTGRVLTVSPVEIYSREQLIATGLQGDIAAALLRLDPSLRP